MSDATAPVANRIRMKKALKNSKISRLFMRGIIPYYPDGIKSNIWAKARNSFTLAEIYSSMPHMFMPSSKGSPLRISCVVLALFVFLISGCQADSKEAGEAAPEAASREGKEKKVLKIKVDIETQKKLQSAADQGFKPWKNDVIEVAKECIIGHGVGAPDKCTVLSESAAQAVVRVTTKKEGSFHVTLKRLVKPDGIWTATKIEKED